MDWRGWAEIVFTIGLTLALSWPLGAWLKRVWTGESTWLDPVLKPVQRGTLAAPGVKPGASQTWLSYAASVLAFNPQGFEGLSPYLAFNTAVSFVTNTNWQSYVPEQTVSTFSQMAGLTVQNFVSAGGGLAMRHRLSRDCAEEVMRSGDIEIDLVSRRVTRTGAAVHL